MRYLVRRDPKTGGIVLVSETGQIFTGTPDHTVPVKTWWRRLWAWMIGG